MESIKNSLVVVGMATILLSCGSVPHRGSIVYSPTFDDIKESKYYLTSSNKTTPIPIEKKERMVVYNAAITLSAKNVDSTNKRLTEIASKYGGYVQTLGSRRSIIRVKAEQLNFAILEIGQLGRLKSKILSGEDITEQYMDFQVRLENAQKARQRYLELLAKAENVEAALKVEKELERLNGEIDAMEGKINRFKHLIQYSTLTINIEEQVKPGILGYIGIGLYRSVKWLFVRN